MRFWFVLGFALTIIGWGSAGKRSKYGSSTTTIVPDNILDYWKRDVSPSNGRRNLLAQKKNATMRSRFKKTNGKKDTRLRSFQRVKLQQNMTEPSSTAKIYGYTNERETSIKHQQLNAYALGTEMLQWIEEADPKVNVTTEILGKTAEFNDIILFKTSQKDDNRYFRVKEDIFSDESNGKKIIFIVHGLSVMGLQYTQCLSKLKYFKILLKYYFAYLDKFDIYLIPIANPDGFAKVMNNPNSDWNKNMSPDNPCFGVAVDRNFDVGWNMRNPPHHCSQQYPGTTPFSEPESLAIRETLHKYSHKMFAYIHVHAGTYTNWVVKGDAVLYPLGFTETQTEDDKYIDMKGYIEESFRNASFETVNVGVDSLYSWYGGVSGTSVDYASTVYDVPYALEFVMQVYGKGQENEFVTDTEEISGNALEEIWQRTIIAVFDSLWKNMNAKEKFRR